MLLPGCYAIIIFGRASVGSQDTQKVQNTGLRTLRAMASYIVLTGLGFSRNSQFFFSESVVKLIEYSK